MVAILSTVLSLLLWWNQSSETDLFQINERVGEISTTLNQHATQIKGLNEKTLSFDKGEELKKFVKPSGSGGFLEGVGKFFESFGSPQEGQKGQEEIERRKRELEHKIRELRAKINSWESEVSKQAEATKSKLAEMARETTEISQHLSGLQIKEGTLSGPRIRWWAFILSLVMTAMAWIAVFWEENPGQEENSNSGNGESQPVPPVEDKIENPATYRVIKQVNVIGQTSDIPQILWAGFDVKELEQLYPRTGDRRTDQLTNFSCNDFDEKIWFEVKTKKGWRVCEDPRFQQ